MRLLLAILFPALLVAPPAATPHPELAVALQAGHQASSVRCELALLSASKAGGVGSRLVGLNISGGEEVGGWLGLAAALSPGLVCGVAQMTRGELL